MKRSPSIIAFVLAVALCWVALAPKAGPPISIADTSWPHVGVTPPIDQLSTLPYSAYSVARKLWSGWTGDAFVVHNTISTQGIGFVGNLIDTNTLLTFCGANSGYVVAVFDQSGNHRHMDRSPATVANNFRIVNAGALETDDNGYPRARSAYGATTYWDDDGAGYGDNVIYGYLVFNGFNHTVNDVLQSLGSTAAAHLRQVTSGGSQISVYAGNADVLGGVYSLGTQYLTGYMVTNAAGSDDYIELNNNGEVTGAAGTATGGTLAVGYQFAAITAGFYFSELFIFNTGVPSAQKTILKNNINLFYTLW